MTRQEIDREVQQALEEAGIRPHQVGCKGARLSILVGNDQHVLDLRTDGMTHYRMKSIVEQIHALGHRHQRHQEAVKARGR